MKRFYIAVTVEENEKYYSYVLPVNSTDNLLSKLTIKNIITANIFETKKRAKEIAQYWNACYKINGTYLFGDGPLY